MVRGLNNIVILAATSYLTWKIYIYMPFKELPLLTAVAEKAVKYCVYLVAVNIVLFF